jgi:phosphohistidine phosphatase SixA
MTSTKKMHVKLLFAAAALMTGCAPAPPPQPEPTPVEGSTTVYLVRHAEKDLSDPKAVDPAISTAGQERAKALATRLGASGIKAIFTSQFRRTIETADPLAVAIGVTPEIVRAGWTTDADSAKAAVFRHKGEKVLFVSHSKTIPSIIEALGGPKLADICESQYSNLFIMYLPPSGKSQLIRQNYGKGDPPPEPGCSSM